LPDLKSGATRLSSVVCYAADGHTHGTRTQVERYAPAAQSAAPAYNSRSANQHVSTVPQSMVAAQSHRGSASSYQQKPSSSAHTGVQRSPHIPSVSYGYCSLNGSCASWKRLEFGVEGP